MHSEDFKERFKAERLPLKDRKSKMGQEDRYCVTFKMSEMREFLDMLSPYLDDNAKMQVKEFLFKLRQKRAKKL